MPQIITSIVNGSPPQVRGKLNTDANDAAITRITPAGAGKTNFTAILTLGTADHPRRCGENMLQQLKSNPAAGSPPQVRGKLFLALIGALPQRITPAGAGKTAGDTL